MVEVFMHVAVGKIFGAHVIKVIRGLQSAPVCDDVGFVRGPDLMLERVEPMEGVFLHGITPPRGEIPLDVRTAYRVRHIKFADGIESGYDLAGSFKIVIRMF